MKLLSFIAGIGFISSVAIADHQLSPQVAAALDHLSDAVNTLMHECPSIEESSKPVVMDHLRSESQRLSHFMQELQTGTGCCSKGAWYQVNAEDCHAFCSRSGFVVGLSPEGAQCVSGENRPASAFGKVTFTYGCWPKQCPPETTSNAVSMGRFCYKPGQKKDNDRTDITVGCYCRRP